MIPSGCVLIISYLTYYLITSDLSQLFFLVLELASNWDILNSSAFWVKSCRPQENCQATSGKRHERWSRDDAFGISKGPVLRSFLQSPVARTPLKSVAFLPSWYSSPCQELADLICHYLPLLPGLTCRACLRWRIRCLGKYEQSFFNTCSVCHFFCASVPCSQFDARFLHFKKHRVFYLRRRHCGEMGNMEFQCLSGLLHYYGSFLCVKKYNKPINTVRQDSLNTINLVDGESIQNNPVRVKFQFPRSFVCLNPILVVEIQICVLCCWNQSSVG